MVRLLLWGVIFVCGLWAGAEYERQAQVLRCHEAGGAIDGRGLCLGVITSG
ncbi:MAG: hypothetical protein AAGF94_04615 [Pseudomonadota bacterium]